MHDSESAPAARKSWVGATFQYDEGGLGSSIHRVAMQCMRQNAAGYVFLQSLDELHSWANGVYRRTDDGRWWEPVDRSPLNDRVVVYPSDAPVTQAQFGYGNQDSFGRRSGGGRGRGRAAPESESESAGARGAGLH